MYSYFGFIYDIHGKSLRGKILISHICRLSMNVNALLQDEFSHLVQQWNLQRSQALERALTKLLYPQMEKELRAKLLSEAKDGIVKVRQTLAICVSGYKREG